MKKKSQIFFRILIIMFIILLLWQLIIYISKVPNYILPTPISVIKAIFINFDLIYSNSLITIIEILLGLIIGTVFGISSALLLACFKQARLWMFPILIISQAIPVFAIAPLLVLWLGYGIASKVGMASIIIFFPITTNFYDGLRKTETGWIELAKTMTNNSKKSIFLILWHIRIPAALPSLGSGLRVGAAVAPIGAIVGEWVGSGAGLGFLMLQANARVQIDLMFAALFVIAIVAVILYYTVDNFVKLLAPWQKDNIPETLD